MDSLIAYMHRRLIKSIGCVKGVIELFMLKKKHQLSSMTSNDSHLVKHLMVLLVVQLNREVRHQSHG